MLSFLCKQHACMYALTQIYWFLKLLNRYICASLTAICYSRWTVNVSNSKQQNCIALEYSTSHAYRNIHFLIFSHEENNCPIFFLFFSSTSSHCNTSYFPINVHFCPLIHCLINLWKNSDSATHHLILLPHHFA